MKTNRVCITLVFLAALLLSGCISAARVGALQTESQSVELADAKSVSVEINFGAGDLNLQGGADKLLEADFNYNVARLKPEVNYSNGKLVVRQPSVDGLPALPGISGFRNEWGLRLNDKVPMQLSVAMGAGSSDLRLGGLSLTGVDINLGAGTYMVDLTGDWARNLDVAIDAGAAVLTVRLPKAVGARVKVESGPHVIETDGLELVGNYYTNAAYGKSKQTMQVEVKAGIGQVNLDVEK